MLDFCVEMIFGGAGGPGALQTSSIGENTTGARSSGFCGTRAGWRWIFELPQGVDARGSWRARRPPDLFGGKKAVPECKFPASAGRGRGGGEYSNFREKMIVGGAGGPGALQTSPPVRSQQSVDTNPHAALRALLAGRCPATPQSPERLRSTPFDCVAIAPCCFAKRKAVLSHALAALTALEPERRQSCYRKSASSPQKIEYCIVYDATL